MTPRRLDADSLNEKLAHMRQLLAQLDALGDLSRDRLEQDTVVRAAAERWLMLLVETAVSINLHVAASRLGRVERDYVRSFDLAAEVGLIDTTLARALAPSGSTRNILVHQYLDTDLDLLATAFALAPGQYAEYVRQVADFVRREVSSGD